ncbi:hypothetical protein HU200_041212 [Digitaria exilis]|uniref:Tyrosine decarboxylase n=1 Tax=Digitaria exilis TaxID=1010633 RepID=A0A835B775_9POAL|nr:hypothetical protein HU200_041212 [Digitaria exilis]
MAWCTTALTENSSTGKAMASLAQKAKNRDGSGSSHGGANGSGGEEYLRPMDAEQLRECGHRMVDFVADYYKSIETFPVLSQVQACIPGYLKNLLPDTAPSKPDTLEALFDDIHLLNLKRLDIYVARPNHSVTLFAALGGGIIQVVYPSDQTHSSLQKACQIAGIFQENVRLVKADCNKNYAVTPEAVSEAIATDLLSGLIPFFICATVSNKHYFVICKLPRVDLEYLFVNLTIAMFPGVTIVIVGTTSSSAVDPLPELGQIAKVDIHYAHDMWFHIDAAYAGSACICAEYRHHLNGVEEADSFNMSAHKWFPTNFDCSLLWVKDKSYLIQSLSTNPEFLKNKVSSHKRRRIRLRIKILSLYRFLFCGFGLCIA